MSSKARPDQFPEVVVDVQPAKNYMPESDDIYRMSSSPRGYALVINNHKFKYEDTRKGSKRDFNYLQQLFAGLGYGVLPFKNLTAEEMENVIANFASQEYHYDMDSCVVAISSHGHDRHSVLGADGDLLDLDRDVFSLFNNVNCPSLMNKPKLFFVQACRGKEQDDGVEVDAKVVIPEYVAPINRLPSWTDMMIVHSSIPGYVSNRDKNEGTWFVQSLVKTFSERACDTDIETMMKKVTKSLIQYKTDKAKMQAPEVIFRGWTKSLYFNPGIFV